MEGIKDGRPFVDSEDDDWDPVANRGELSAWVAAIDEKVNKEGTSERFMKYAYRKIQRE